MNSVQPGTWRNWQKVKLWLPGVLSVVLLLVALVVVNRTLSGVRIADIKAHYAMLGVGHVLIALSLTAIAYLVLTLYDYLALHHVGFPLSWKKMAPTSFNAFAVGRNVGFATLSGGAIRYRAYSAAGLDAPRIAEIIAFCLITFLLGASFLLGVALLNEPVTILSNLPITIEVTRAIGWMLLALPLLYLVVSINADFRPGWGHWRLRIPRTRIVVAQLSVGATELIVAALTLYVLQPPESAISFLSFLGVYLICMAIGMLSTVPGGVGVFEGGMLLLMHSVPKAELIGSLLAFRFLYYVVPFVLALAVLALQISLKNKLQVRSVVSRSTLILTQAAPQIASGAVFVAGAVLLFSGNLPSDIDSINVLNGWLPAAILQVSHLLASVIGLTLLILARGLYRRLEGAFWLTILLLLAGSVLSLLKGFDTIEMLVLWLVAGLLYTCKPEFDRKASLLEEPFTGGWFLSIAMVVGGAVWLGLFSYRHVEYDTSLWWNFAVDRDVPKMLRASVVSVVLLLSFGLFRLTRTSAKLSLPNTAADVHLARSIIRNSTGAQACAALTGDKRFLFNVTNDAFIMYQISGSSAIAMGDPVGDIKHFPALLWAYRELCDKLDKRCVFYQVGRVHLPLYIDLGLAFSKLGEEARVPLSSFSLEGPKRAEFRQAVNRARREGAAFEVVPAEGVAVILPQLRSVSDAWLASKNAREKGFSVGRFEDSYLSHSDIAVVRVNGEIVAFANLWAAGDRSELSVDLMRHSEFAPKGIMDYLFTELMLWGKQNGYTFFTLGMAPLSGLEHHPLAPLWHKFGNLIYRYAVEFYNFEGLRKYKQKFNPEWEPRYLAASGGVGLPKTLVDVTALISGGIGGAFSR